jgi:hypothetical protein
MHTMAEPATRQQEEKLPEKKVSPKALTRLGHAKAAIAVTKQVLSFGAGNQVEAIRATKMNSRFRLQAIRNHSYWEMAPEIRHLAMGYPDALVAAKADLVHGGNCGEHAYIAYDYLRQHVSGERIQYAASEIDHAFVFIGDFKKEAASEVAVADPWPTAATACLWEDHFCLNTKVNLRHDAVADGKSIKGAIAAGLRLNAAGKAAAAQSSTQAETDSAVADWKANHFWNQPDSVAAGSKFNYVSDKPSTTVK